MPKIKYSTIAGNGMIRRQATCYAIRRILWEGIRVLTLLTVVVKNSEIKTTGVLEIHFDFEIINKL